MLREAHYFIIVLMFILLVTALLTFFLTYSILPPKDDDIPRRSRPVLANLTNEVNALEQEFGSNINERGEAK